MKFILKRKPVDYIALEKGTYPGRLIGIVGVGEQAKNFKGRTEMKDQIELVFEIIGMNRRHKDGTEYTMEVNGQQVPEPQTVRHDYSRSMAANSNLVKVLSSLIAIPDDVTELDIVSALLKPCLVVVDKKVSEATGNEYNVIESVNPPMIGMEMPPARLKPYCYDVEEHDEEAFKQLPDWLQEMVQKSTQWIDMHANSTPVQTMPPTFQQIGGQVVNTQTGEVAVYPLQMPMMQPPAQQMAQGMQPQASPMMPQLQQSVPTQMPMMQPPAQTMAQPVQQPAAYTQPVQTMPQMTSRQAQEEVPF